MSSYGAATKTSGVVNLVKDLTVDITGMHVLIVLAIGNLLTCVTGLLDGSFDLMSWIHSTLQGVMGMSELILISMMAGGIFAAISYNGGMEFMLKHISRRISTSRGAELSICSLVAFANVCTANNTVAILSVGGMARRVAEQYDIDPRRSASLLDTLIKTQLFLTI